MPKDEKGAGDGMPPSREAQDVAHRPSGTKPHTPHFFQEGSDSGRAPEKADLISLRQAIKVATDSGFPKEIQNIRFGYSEEAGSQIWEMSYTVSSDEYVSVDRILEVDAPNGRVVRDYRQGGIH